MILGVTFFTSFETSKQLFIKFTFQQSQKKLRYGCQKTRKYQDKDGNDRYTTEVVLQPFNSNLTLLDSRSSNTDNSSQNQIESSSADSSSESVSSNAKNDNIDDDIPF